MINITKKKIKYLIWAIITTFVLSVSIVGVVMFAVYHKWLMMAFSIFICALNLYAMPLLWVYLAEAVHLESLLKIIRKKKVQTVDELKVILHRSTKSLVRDLNYLYLFDYAPGFVFNGEKISF